MINIIGYYLIILGLGVFLLVIKVVFLGGVYDIWVLGGGDVWVIINFILNFVVIFGYLFKVFFGGEGWIIGVNNMEDIIGGYIWIGLICIFGGIWYILIKFFGWVCCVFIWFGEVYLFYSLGVLFLMGLIVAVFVWFNNIVYFSEFYGFINVEVF